LAGRPGTSGGKSNVCIGRTLSISFIFNTKQVSDPAANRRVTVGTRLALLKCIKASLKRKKFRRKEQPDESQDEHEGRQRTVGQLIQGLQAF
jgi:hypothetical protein